MTDKTKLSDERIEAAWNSLDGRAIIAGENQLNWNRSIRKAFARAIESELATSRATDAPAQGEWGPVMQVTLVRSRNGKGKLAIDYYALPYGTTKLYAGPVATPAASPVASIPTWQERYAEARSNLTAPRIPAGLAEECKDAEIADLRAALAGAPVASDPKKAPGTRDDFNIISNARSLLSKTRSDQTKNWVLAMDMFAVGSTSAHKICRDAGIDPDATVVARAALAKMEGA